MMAAAARAAHLIVDKPPVIFADTCAGAVLGEHAEELVGYHRKHGNHLILAAARGQVICRSRFAEDRLAAAAANGVRQYLILGAGLDTFGYRSPLAPAVRVFEVDHPATQGWKQSALAAAGLDVPPGVVFVPADLAASAPGSEEPGNGLTNPSIPNYRNPPAIELRPHRAAPNAFFEPTVREMNTASRQ